MAMMVMGVSSRRRAIEYQIQKGGGKNTEGKIDAADLYEWLRLSQE
jgi:hypothetical protein